MVTKLIFSSMHATLSATMLVGRSIPLYFFGVVAYRDVGARLMSISLVFLLQRSRVATEGKRRAGSEGQINGGRFSDGRLPTI